MAMYKSGQKYPYPFKHCRLEELAERAMAVSCAAGRVAAAKLPHGGGARLDSRSGGARGSRPLAVERAMEHPPQLWGAPAVVSRSPVAGEARLLAAGG